MFEKLRIKEHMEIADANGQHLGTVDELDGDTIKLTRSDSGDGRHHFVALDSVDRIDDNRIYLKAGAPAPQAHDRVPEQMSQTGTQPQFGNGRTINPDEYSTQRSTVANPAAQSPLFGTSGEGTGFGGSGAGN